MRYTLFLTILVLALGFPRSYAQEKITQDPISKSIHKRGKAFIKKKNISSVSIGILKDGKTYTQHFGELERGKGNLPTNKSIYEIGSVSKTMTGYLVAKAVKEGKIHLSDDVRTYLAEGYDNLSYEGKPITIRHLVTHTSGLPLFLPLELSEVFKNLDENIPQKYYEFDKAYSKDKFLTDLQRLSLTVEPGTQYAYSNAGAELMGHVLETVYGKSIDTLLGEAFLEEYQMDQTSIVLSEEQKQHLVRGYWMENNSLSPNHPNTIWGTGGGVSMSMPDMLRYMELQLATSQALVSESHRILYEEGSSLKVAYYWRIRTDKYGTSFNHHGGTIGVQNWLFIFPDHELGISIITNQSGPQTPQLLSKTVKKILNDILEV